MLSVASCLVGNLAQAEEEALGQLSRHLYVLCVTLSVIYSDVWGISCMPARILLSTPHASTCVKADVKAGEGGGCSCWGVAGG